MANHQTLPFRNFSDMADEDKWKPETTSGEDEDEEDELDDNVQALYLQINESSPS